ncbi:MAG: hypothetical protein AAFY48_00735, partial [Bacteroidota bacterium]
MVLAIGVEKHFQKLCQLISAAHLAHDER